MAVSLPADVVSMNLAHRHLTHSQLIAAASKLESYYAEEAKKRQVAAADARHGKLLPVNLPEAGDARDLAGKICGVSGKTVDRAELILKQGIPELVLAAGVA